MFNLDALIDIQFPGIRLGQVIEMLEKQPPEKKIKLGWGKGSSHSYRGYYYQLAFEPKENVTIKEMLDEAKSAVGSTYMGWKGGNFKMSNDSPVNLAVVGDLGDPLTKSHFELMLGE